MATFKVYVGNIPYSSDDQSMREFFGDGKHCAVTKVYIPTDRESGRPRGFAFVELSSAAEAEAAIRDLDGAELGGRRIVVNQAHEQEKGGGRRGEGKRDGGGRRGRG